ncbi:MAG: hypothetical protein ACYCTE_03295 [Acidimicrobiales bacterium]
MSTSTRPGGHCDRHRHCDRTDTVGPLGRGARAGTVPLPLERLDAALYSAKRSCKGHAALAPEVHREPGIGLAG